jgi:cytochrome c5
MRAGLLILAVSVPLSVAACRQAKAVDSRPGSSAFATAYMTSRPTKPDFESEIKPIFQARCQPCHFQGGKVYDRMPFDKAETITQLGTKLFTRIKDEKERQKIREFLDQR